MNKAGKFIKKMLIIVGITVGMLFIAVIAITIYSMRQNQKRYDEIASSPREEYVPPKIAFEVVDSDKPLEIDTYQELEVAGKKSIYIYDMEYLDIALGYHFVTSEEIKTVIAENDGIGQRFKDLLDWYVDAITEKYPEADLRVLYENLKTIEVVECSSQELAVSALSLSSYGCYKWAENKIYVNEEYEYEPGTWEYQVIVHEFGHAARTMEINEEDLQIRVYLSSEYLEIPQEALNSIFTVSLFDYEERDIAYQLQSNMFLALVDCLDGYTLSDYINHSLSYFAHMLDAQNGDNNYAWTIMRLIQEQRTDGMDDRYERVQEVYYPIYHYLVKMYLDRYAANDMSDEEITALIDELLDIVMYDVPKEYNIDTAEFYRYASEYMAQ